MPSFLKTLTARMRGMFSRRQEDAEFSDELREHLDMLTEENVRRGMPLAEARREAKIRLGGAMQLRETHRELTGIPFLETVFQDIRYALRMLRKNPGFTAVAVLTLALGIGANTAIFSFVNGVILEPLPFPNSDRLVLIDVHGAESYLNFLDWQRESKSFSAMFAYRSDNLALTGRGEPTVVHGAIISSGIFAALRAAPLLGRVLGPTDEIPGAGRVVIISEEFWRGRFGANPRVVGEILALNAEPFTVVGVMPDRFRFPGLNPRVQFWIPILQSPDYGTFAQNRNANFLTVVGQLRPGMTIPQALAEVTHIVQVLDGQQHGVSPGQTVHIENLKRVVIGDVQPVLLILLGAVGLVVLIACANVANLLLARANSRRREIAVRLALGAGRARIFRQLLSESILLGICGGVAGLALAYEGIAGINSIASDQLPHFRNIGVDGPVLAFTFLIAIVAGVLFGLAPAKQSFEIGVSEGLRGSGQNLAVAQRYWARHALVIVEVSLAVVLLVGSGLLLRSFYLLMRTNPGFDPQHILTATVALPRSQYAGPRQWSDFFGETVERLKSAPGIEDAAGALPIPFTWPNLVYRFTIVGQPVPSSSETLTAQEHSVTPDYFRVMRMSLFEGREFTAADMAPNAGRSVIVNEALAQRYFAHDDPLAHSLQIKGMLSSTKYDVRIIGVVGDVKDKSLSDPDKPMLYFPYTQEPLWQMSFVARTKGEPSSVAGALRAEIHSIDSMVAVDDVQPLTSLISDSEGDARFRSILLGLFGMLALVLATLGIYGVLAHVVMQRTHEIGIRMALGARRYDVLRLIVGQGMRSVIIGMCIGVGTALALSRVLTGFLYGISDKDPSIFISVLLLFTIVALAACYIPARRAMKVDPMVALRYE